jgi:aryl-alcohol dehydrogenase-like predicted oxidoreductase
MTLGTVQLGMEYGIANNTGKPDRDESFGILGEAIKGGVNSFDTALAYGDTEVVLGEYFSQNINAALDLVITTKFVFKEKKQLAEKEIEEQVMGFVHQSLSRLKISKLPIVMLHHYDDLAFYGPGLANAMHRIKSEGLADKIGVSVHNPYTIRNVLDYGCFDAIQAPINILDTRIPRSGLLEDAKKEDMIVFARSVFLQGLIFKDNLALPQVLECAGPYLDKLRNFAERENMGIAQLAVSYVRDLPGVTSLVVGSETKQQVSQNIEYVNAPALSEDTAAEIQKAFGDIPEIVLNPVKWKIR